MKKVIFLFIIASLGFTPLLNAQGCMDSGSEDGVQVIGFVQPQYDYMFKGDDADGNSLNESSFRFNRARIGVTGNIPYDFSYYVMVEFSPFLQFDHPYLLDAFVTYKRLGPYFNLSMGSFKSPIGLELNTACHKLHTINRSIVVSELAAPFRDLGIMATGGSDSLTIGNWKTHNLIKYSVAWTNGGGIGMLDDNMFKTFAGRIVLTPIKYVSIGGSYLYGENPPAAAEATENDVKKRWGFDLQIKVKDLLIQGEYLNGSDVGSYTTGGGCGEPIEVHEGTINREGFFAQAMYMTPWKLQPVIKFESYDPNLETDYVMFPEAENDRQNVITYGLNFFPNEWTRVQINYLYKAEESASAEVPNDCFSIQVQAVF